MIVDDFSTLTWTTKYMLLQIAWMKMYVLVVADVNNLYDKIEC